MARHAPYRPYPRRYPPLRARDVEANRRRAGRVIFGSVCALALVLLVGAIDWTALEASTRDDLRDLIREEVQEEMDRRQAEAPGTRSVPCDGTRTWAPGP